MKAFVLSLAALNMADSISFMIVTPSLAMYIDSLGGSQDFYGFVLAVYSFMSFCGKPVLGRWSDVYNFNMPFMVSISCSVLGGVFYAIAPAFTNLRAALASVAIGRILGGLGRANSALTFAYVARACEASERTSVSSLLGGLQMIGMVIAPLFSAFLSNVDFDFLGVHFNNLNSVGLLLVVVNVIPQIMIHLFLPDLPKSEESNDNGEESEWLRMFRCTLKNPHIGVPFITIFVFNFNFQFIETALAPSAQDALQLGPTQTSYILGIMSVLVFAGMALVHQLSKNKVSDFHLLTFGLFVNSIGYALLYMLWYRGVPYIAFVLPVIVAAGSYPFLGAPNRSIFAAAVDATAELSGFEGSMQSLLSMASSVAGFTSPFLITHFCMRTPEEVSLSHDKREFSPLAFISPLLGLAALYATYLAGGPGKHGKELKEDVEVGETTPLAQMPPVHKRCSLQQAGKRASVRGSILCSVPMMPQTGEIYDDDDEEDWK